MCSIVSHIQYIYLFFRSLLWGFDMLGFICQCNGSRNSKHSSQRCSGHGSPRYSQTGTFNSILLKLVIIYIYFRSSLFSISTIYCFLQVILRYLSKLVFLHFDQADDVSSAYASSRAPPGSSVAERLGTKESIKHKKRNVKLERIVKSTVSFHTIMQLVFVALFNND